MRGVSSRRDPRAGHCGTAMIATPRAGVGIITTPRAGVEIISTPSARPPGCPGPPPEKPWHGPHPVAHSGDGRALVTRLPVRALTGAGWIMGPEKDARRRRPLLLLAAWLSPAIPLALLVAMAMAPNPDPNERGSLVFLSAGLACSIGLTSAVAGLFGVRDNGAWATVPAAVLGLLLNAGIGLLTLFFWGLSGLRG